MSLFEHLEARRLLAAATVNWNDVRQPIDGFGASSAWASGTLSATTVEQLYSTSTGAGLSLLRMRMAPRGQTTENLIGLQAAAAGARVWSTPWSPPREWKTTRDTNNGGALEPARYQDYATLLADYVQDLDRQGLPLYALSLQNEPNWVAEYESCIWNADQFAAFLPVVGQTFAARGITTKLMLPESLNWNFSLAAKVMADPNLAQYVGILAAHNYGETANSYQPVAIAAGKPVWETEVFSNATTELGTALDLADDIHQAMSDANASAYHYWWLSANSANGGLTGSNYTPTKRLWAMGQYSRFVRPGWVRIGATDDGGIDVTTFKDPASGKFAIVVANTSAAAVNETFTLNGFSAASVTPYITSATDNLQQYADIALAGGTTFTQSIAANSIVTYYGTSTGAPTVQAPTNLTVAPTQGFTTGRLSLTWNDNSSAETAYTVERSTDGSAWTVLTTTLPANTTRYADTGLSENTAYFYRVKPTNGLAATYSAAATDATVLQAPSGLGATRTATGFNLTWTIGSPTSTGVTIHRSTDGLTWTNVATLSTRATNYADTVSGYSASQIYYYRVRNTLGTSVSSYAAYHSGLQTPTNFTATAATTNTVTVTWTSPTVGTSGAWIEQYTAATNSWKTVSPSSLQATAGVWKIAGLAANTAYTFRLRVSSMADGIYSGYTANLAATTKAPSPTPVVWYKADETAGPALADASGNAKTAALTGSFGFATGLKNNAVTLTGGNAVLPVGVVSELGEFSIATWVRLTSVDTWSRVFDFGSGTNNFMMFTPRASQTSRPRFSINAGTGQQFVDSSVAMTANTWTHVAVTLTGGVATLYLNGVAVGSNAAVTVTPASMGQTTLNYLGKSQSTADPSLRGGIDDFRIYERALSAGEVAALADPTPPPTVVAAAVASPNPVTGKTASLSVLGTDDAGEANLLYTWSATGPGAVTFSANGTNAAKNAVATFTKAGTYTVTATLTDAGLNSVTTSTTVTVVPVFSGIAAAQASMFAGFSQQISPADQFGNPIAFAGLAWSASAGSVFSDGQYVAPNAGVGSVTITATAGANTFTTTIAVVAPRAWYKADTLTNGTLADASGNALDGTLTGTYAAVAGQVGQGVNLSGGYATVPNSVVGASADLTVSLWVRPTATTAWARLFDFGTGTSKYMFLAAANNSGYLRFAATTTGTGGEQTVGTTTTLANTTWSHVALTIAGTTATLYVNGVAVGANAAFTLNPAVLGALTQTWIGKSQYAADATFKGGIDDFRLYPAAASANVVAALYNAGAAAPTAAPTAVTAVAGPRIDLAWTDNAAGEIGYLVERSTSASFTTGLTSFTLAPGSTAYADTAVSAGTTYHYRVTALLAGGITAGPTAAPPVTAVAAPSISSFVVNDGSTQRSMVTSLTLHFSTPVRLGSGAIVLSGVNGGPASITYAMSPTNDASTFVLSFPGLAGGSLADGQYRLKVTASAVTAVGSTATLAGDATFGFHRLFADGDGNGAVDFNDFLGFQAAFASTPALPTWTAAFDYDGNQAIDFNDFLALQNRFGTRID